MGSDDVGCGGTRSCWGVNWLDQWSGCEDAQMLKWIRRVDCFWSYLSRLWGSLWCQSLKRICKVYSNRTSRLLVEPTEVQTTGRLVSSGLDIIESCHKMWLFQLGKFHVRKDLAGLHTAVAIRSFFVTNNDLIHTVKPQQTLFIVILELLIPPIQLHVHVLNPVPSVGYLIWPHKQSKDLSWNGFGPPCPHVSHAGVLGCQSVRENYSAQTQPSNRQQRLEPFPPQRGRREKRASHIRRQQVNTTGLVCSLPISRACLCAWEEKGKEKKFLSRHYFHYGRCANVWGKGGKRRLQKRNWFALMKNSD